MVYVVNTYSVVPAGDHTRHTFLKFFLQLHDICQRFSSLYAAQDVQNGSWLEQPQIGQMLIAPLRSNFCVTILAQRKYSMHRSAIPESIVVYIHNCTNSWHQ